VYLGSGDPFFQTTIIIMADEKVKHMEKMFADEKKAMMQRIETLAQEKKTLETKVTSITVKFNELKEAALGEIMGLCTKLEEVEVAKLKDDELIASLKQQLAAAGK
jgi:hypothetical protein